MSEIGGTANVLRGYCGSLLRKHPHVYARGRVKKVQLFHMPRIRIAVSLCESPRSGATSRLKKEIINAHHLFGV